MKYLQREAHLHSGNVLTAAFWLQQRSICRRNPTDPNAQNREIDTSSENFSAISLEVVVLVTNGALR